MSLMQCTVDGKPGYKWGEGGKCYPYNRGNLHSEMAAKAAARNDGLAQAVVQDEKEEQKTLIDEG